MKREECFAILRVDDGQHVSVKIIVWTRDEVEREVARLNELNNAKGCLYSWVTTRAQAREVDRGRKDAEDTVEAIRGDLEEEQKYRDRAETILGAVRAEVTLWESYAEDLEDSQTSMRRIQALVATQGAREGTDESEPAAQTVHRPCGNCGNPLELSEGPGRLRSYRGQPGYEVPPTLTFPWCPNCGAEWMTGPQVDALGDAFEEQRLHRSGAARCAECDPSFGCFSNPSQCWKRASEGGGS